ncbi:serine/threonine-protein kinase [Polyangium mundeleinium]|uniref:Serine/threonine-protein kinase n=1 Tax=Polyangium mundeleinium TaxID=2995306 RepID=A0ABT5EKZ1_9BACT|nr:serine/threonine-protein kinase [Polyangium mundeleinium]MDC0742474.1 serine/threonine-protein kinase [Polyangium mundeleinium]
MARAGELLGERYRLIRAIGAGGMGTVWWARDERIGRDVALKLSPPESNGTRAPCFVREAHIAAQVSHPNVVGVLDAGEATPQRRFLVMELLRGETLAARLRPREPLPVAEALSITIEVCRGLEAIHAQGIVHRDVKPENIFLADVPGEGRVPKLLDFGCSSRATGARPLPPPFVPAYARSSEPNEPAHEGTPPGLGTPQYMSPEQARGEEDVDGRADLWALGAVLYEALAGRAPFDGTDVDGVIDAVLTEEPGPLPGWVPEGARRLVAKCLEKDRRRRYPDARSLRLALEEAFADFMGAHPSSSTGFTRTRGSSMRPPARSTHGRLGGITIAATLVLFAVASLPSLEDTRQRAALQLHATVGDAVKAAAGRTREAALHEASPGEGR